MRRAWLSLTCSLLSCQSGPASRATEAPPPGGSVRETTTPLLAGSLSFSSSFSGSLPAPSPPPVPPTSAPASPGSTDSPPAPPPFPCAPPDLGWGFYLPYESIEGGRVSLPFAPVLPVGGVFEVHVHFHASDAARRGMVRGEYPAVFIGVDRGEGSSSYKRDFEDPAAFRRLLAGAEERLRARYGDRVKLGPIVLSSWSAGFGAVVPLVKHFSDRVRAVVLLDSLYASQQRGASGRKLAGTVLPGAVAPVEAFARRALRGEKELFLSYSDVPTTGYASTSEVASYLSRRLGLTLAAVDPGDDPRGPVTRLDQGGLHLRGFAGRDARAHCRHLALVGEAVDSVRTRWPVVWERPRDPDPSHPPPAPQGEGSEGR